MQIELLTLRCSLTSIGTTRCQCNHWRHHTRTWDCKNKNRFHLKEIQLRMFKSSMSGSILRYAFQLTIQFKKMQSVTVTSWESLDRPPSWVLKALVKWSRRRRWGWAEPKDHLNGFLISMVSSKGLGKSLLVFGMGSWTSRMISSTITQKVTNRAPALSRSESQAGPWQFNNQKHIKVSLASRARYSGKIANAYGLLTEWLIKPMQIS